ncbi:MAG: hypothetical protein DWQ08_14275, partial [Proteobacteria bacterium]
MERNIDRRRFLQRTAGLTALASLPGCASSPRVGARRAGLSAFPNPLVDAHAHVFNASDLPAARFIRRVMLSLYAETGDIAEFRRIEDPDFIDALIKLFLAVLGAEGAPTAREEIEVLSGLRPATKAFTRHDAEDPQAIEGVAEFLLQRDEGAPGALSGDPEQSLRLELLRAGGATAAELRAPGMIDTTAALSTAKNAFRSEFAIGRVLRWFALFRKYRYALVDRVAEMYADQNVSAVLIAPALVDYSRWLQESPRSPFHDQVEVLGLIASRPSGPVIHSYAPFDPLREIYYRKASTGGNPAETEAALELVETALDEHGFIGVKLYPPMGFRPTGNIDESVYPKHVIDDIGPTLGAQLDEAMEDLFVAVESRDACVLAHAANSNESGDGFGQRADPAYWLPVFRAHPRLRVCLAHFGGFDSISASAVGSTRPENSWEWTLGAYLDEHRRIRGGEAPVYGDLSYYSEVLVGDSAKRSESARYLLEFIRRFDPDCRHLLYGSDWMMLGIERNHVSYAKIIEEFLAEDCALDAQRRERIMFGNAYR